MTMKGKAKKGKKGGPPAKSKPLRTDSRTSDINSQSDVEQDESQ